MSTDKVKKRSMAGEIWRRLLRNKMAVAGLVILALLALSAIFADFIADYDTKVVAQDVVNRLRNTGLEQMNSDVTFLRVSSMEEEFLW